MVTEDGLPIGYELFEGNKYEGHTLIPALMDIIVINGHSKLFFADT